MVLHILLFLFSTDILTPTIKSQDAKTDFLTTPSPTEEKSAALSVVASGKYNGQRDDELPV